MTIAVWSTRRTAVSVAVPDPRRALQLSLAGLWLLDGVLQLQPFMFTREFARQVLAPSAHGNPAVVAAPITSVAHLVAQHPVGANTAFAVTQILIGLGIAWRPAVKPALVASIGWALAVWWLGEGFGGILTGNAGPVTGGPGAALLYAVLAVLLWPTGSAADSRPFVAAGAVGVARARLVWLALWGSLAGFAVTGASRSAQGLHDAIASMAVGQPGWLAAIEGRAAALVDNRGLAASIVIALGCAAIAVGGLGGAAAVRASVIAAIGFGLVIAVGAQAIGEMFGGQSTDPGTGPLLALIALAYWPLTRPASSRQAGAAC